MNKWKTVVVGLGLLGVAGAFIAAVTPSAQTDTVFTNVWVTGTSEFDGAVDFDGAVVFSSSVTGITSTDLSGDITLENDEAITNGTDGTVAVTYDEDGATQGAFTLQGVSASSADADHIDFIVSMLNDDEDSQFQVSRWVNSWVDATSNTLNSKIELFLQFDGSAAAANAEVLDVDEDQWLVTLNNNGATLGEFEILGKSTTSADSDHVDFLLSGKDEEEEGTFQMARLIATWIDATSNTLDSSLTFAVQTDGSADAATAELVLNGAALYPYADAGLNLGIATTNQMGSVITDTLVVGTTPATLAKGTAVVDQGSQTDTLSLTGTDSDDVCIVTLNTDNSATTATLLRSAAPGTNQVVVTLNDEAATTITYSYMVWQD